MTLPRYPSYFFKRPFADEGSFRIIDDEKPVSGRASLKEGFPEETQNPLGYGGVAPNRMDFNGILNMMSSMLCWTQSGGMWRYSSDLNYVHTNLVLHEHNLWWCVRENGPDAAEGIVEPGTDNNYWIEFLLMLAAECSKDIGGVPVGTVISYYGKEAPDGYFPCDGSVFSVTGFPNLYRVLGSSFTPDMRGLFIRGLDTTAKHDPDGETRELATVQLDAGRNVEGSFNADDSQVMANAGNTRGKLPTGCFYGVPHTINLDLKSQGGSGGTLVLDASRSWGEEHTADEFRPCNINLLYCIKHD